MSVIVFGLAGRHGCAATGDVDATFAPGFINSTVGSTVMQPDGRVILIGSFTTAGGVARNGIARFSANGVLDSSFNPNLGGGTPSVLVIQPDRRIVIGGSFTSVAGVTRNHIARLLPDGSLDTSFDPNADGTVSSILRQPDGRLVISGSFVNVGGFTRNRIARLNEDGTVDATFNPNASEAPVCMALQADGKLLVGGDFSYTIGGVTRNGLARLNADGSLEAGFNAAVNFPAAIWCVTVQPDGKILVGGTFTSIAGQARNRIARLNSDGTLDSAFNPNASDLVRVITLQADGKMFVGGDFGTIGGATRTALARLNANGTIDPAFNPVIVKPVGSPPNVNSVMIQGDGMVLLGGNLGTINGLSRDFAARLQNDAATQSLDMPDFSTIRWLRGGAMPEASEVEFEVSTDRGATYTLLGAGARVSGGWEFITDLPQTCQIRTRAHFGSHKCSGWIASAMPYGRPAVPEIAVEKAGLNLPSGGSADFGIVHPGSTNSLTFTILNTGEADLTGLGITIDGPDTALFSVTASPVGPVTGPTGSTSFIVRFAPTSVGERSVMLHLSSNDADEGIFDIALTGSSVLSANADLSALTLNYSALTPAFTSSTFDYTAAVRFNNTTVTLTPTAAQPAAAILVNGSATTSGSASLPISLAVGENTISIHVTAQNGVATRDYSITVTRAASALAGDADATFNPAPIYWVTTSATQPDGKIIIGGTFTAVGSVARSRIARLNVDGTLDQSFNTGAGASVDCILVQTDGRIVVAGSFTTIGGVARNRIARLNADGSLDSGFTPDANAAVTCLVLQPDGKMIIGGDFTVLGGVTRNHLARLNADGTLDTGFNPNVSGTNVYSAIIQSDGKIIVGGNLTTVGGVTRSYLARIDADGTLDATYNPNPNGTVTSIALQPDGKVLLSGAFSNISGVSRGRIARLNGDGTADAAFDPTLGGSLSTAYHIAQQCDGKIILGGDFTTVGGIERNRMARLSTDSSLDTGFNPNANGTLYSVAMQADGRIVVGGSFTTVAGWSRPYCARIENDAAVQSLSVPDSSRIEWLRGGTSPEAAMVTFDQSTDGGVTWSSLGLGTRIAGGWTLTGLSLPPSLQVRARARIASGRYDSSSGLIETIREFPPTVLGTWRQAWFGSPANSGDGADLSDYDRDGLPNLLEYAFASDPTRASASAMPAWTTDGNLLTVSFDQPPGTSGILYGAEWSSDLLANAAAWIDIADTGIGGHHVFSVPTAAGSPVFVRLVITLP